MRRKCISNLKGQKKKKKDTNIRLAKNIKNSVAVFSAWYAIEMFNYPTLTKCEKKKKVNLKIRLQW